MASKGSCRRAVSHSHAYSTVSTAVGGAAGTEPAQGRQPAALRTGPPHSQADHSGLTWRTCGCRLLTSLQRRALESKASHTPSLPIRRPRPALRQHDLREQPQPVSPAGVQVCRLQV